MKEFTKMRQAYYIDTFSKGNLHEMFDASSLLMFSNIFDKIEYRSDKDSKQNVSALLEEIPSNIRHKSLYIPNDKNILSRFLKQILAVFYNCYFILRSFEKDDWIIINYNTMIALYPINWITRLFKKKVLIICHGEMYDFYKVRKVSFFYKKSMSFFQKPNLKIAEGLYFAVLGEYVKNNLKEIISEQSLKKIMYFDHTAIFNSPKEKNSNKTRRTQVGIIGALRQNKGIDDILEIIGIVKETNPNIDFFVIGGYDYEKSFLEEKGFILPQGVNGSFLCRTKMNDLISEMDYSLFLLPKDIYKFTASGSFFDALNCETPVIALENDFFEYYYNKYGSFGYLCKSKSEIILRLSSIHNMHKTDVYDFKIIKEQLSPLEAAKKLKLITNEA